MVTLRDVAPESKSDVSSNVVQPKVTNSMPGLSPLVTSPEATMIDDSAERSASVASPLNNAAIPMGRGILDVTPELRAPLGFGESLALYRDHETVVGLQTSAVWTLSYMTRGPNLLQASRFSSAGETLDESDKITVVVLRPSILRAAPR